MLIVTPAKAQGCLGKRIRFRDHDPVQPRSIPVAGLVPATHVSRPDTAAASRRGCLGQARARGSWRPSSWANAPQNCRSTFPAPLCAFAGMTNDLLPASTSTAVIRAFADHRWRRRDARSAEASRSSGSPCPAPRTGAPPLAERSPPSPHRARRTAARTRLVPSTSCTISAPCR